MYSTGSIMLLCMWGVCTSPPPKQTALQCKMSSSRHCCLFIILCFSKANTSALRIYWFPIYLKQWLSNPVGHIWLGKQCNLPVLPILTHTHSSTSYLHSRVHNGQPNFCVVAAISSCLFLSQRGSEWRKEEQATCLGICRTKDPQAQSCLETGRRGLL